MADRTRHPSGGPGATASPSAAASGPAAVESKDVNLKVMRLSKPGFHLDSPIYCDGDELPAIASGTKSMHQLFFGDPSSPTNCEASFGLSKMLSLPHAFGNIYLGEKFSSYICVNNSSPFELSDVIIKAELQSQTQKVLLLDTATSALPKFAPAANADFVVHHVLQDPGIHMLVCSANYTRPDGEKKFFRKYFKFQVMTPFELQTKTQLLGGGSDFFLELSLQNITQGPVYVESVLFESAEVFSFSDLSANTGDAPTGNTSAGSIFFMKPSVTRQYLFKLSPKVADDVRLKAASALLGSLAVTWRGHLSETGYWKTDIIERRLPTRDDVELRFVEVPRRIVLEQPFTVQCEILNRTDRSLAARLVLVKSKMIGIVVAGVSGQHLGLIGPNSRKQIPLTLFPLKLGMQKINGLQIAEMQSDKKYDFDNITSVMVVSDSIEADAASSTSSSSSSSIVVAESLQK